MRRSTNLSKAVSARAIALLGSILLVLALAQPANATSGTLFITSDTTLIEDHTGEIVIAADGVTLDCAGHLVTSDPSSWAAILVNNQDDVTIRNCRVTNGGNGIAVAGFSERTVVEGNEAFANAGAGIAADQAVDTRIIDNRATDNVGNGIQVIEATGVVVVGNVSSGNQGTAGIATFDAHESVFRGNTVVGNVNTGISIHESDRNVVAGNRVERNGRGGIALVSASENSLSTNLVRANVDADSSGVFLLASSRNDLRANVSVANGFDGFEIADGSHANVLVDNVAGDNPVNGFSVGRSNDNRLSSNVSVGNFRGFYIVEQERSIVVGNFASGNGGFAFEMHQVASAMWSGNSARGNGGGFLLDAVIASLFIGNVSDAARESGGFHIFAASNDNVFRANVSTSNAGPGFIVEGSNGNIFNLNVARRNSGGGIWIVLDSSFNTLTANTACKNGDFDALDDGTGAGNRWKANVFCTTSGI